MNKSVFIALIFMFPLISPAELVSNVRVRIRNSSNYVYPCNAGIAKNSRASGKGVDFVSASWGPSQQNPTSIAGQGVAIGGAITNNNADPDFTILSSLLNGGSQKYLSYNELLPESQMYNYIVGQSLTGSGITVNLESDTYNSGFYITFCFRPSMIGNDSNVPQSLNFIHARATHSMVPGEAYNYATEAKLTSMVEIKCSENNYSDIQHYTATGPGSIDNLMTPFEGNTTIDMAPSGGGIPISAGVTLISGSAPNAGEMPEACRIRFYFIETAGTFRSHNMTQSDIQIDLEAYVGAL